MKIGIAPLIAENIAPDHAASLAIYNGNRKVCTVDISKMRPSGLGEKLYSFGLLSDIHLEWWNFATTETRFDNALTYFENQGCSFCCVSGDLTGTGFWRPLEEPSGASYYEPVEFDSYKAVCQKHNIPVYACAGNHESYNGYDISKTYTDTYGADPTLVVNNLAKWQEYTGTGLTFTVTQGNDVFIFVGQSTQTLPMTVEHLQWLYEQLEANRNKRCFVFIHPYVSAQDSGDPLGLHSLPLFDYWGTTNKTAFISLLSHYKNTVLFHGHSHVHFETQQQQKNAIYSKALGFRSIHVPSTASGRKIINGSLGSKDASCSLGYLVEVYENCIVLKGYDFIGNSIVPIAQYCIDTTLQTVAEGTFVDSTGTITT